MFVIVKSQRIQRKEKGVVASVSPLRFPAVRSCELSALPSCHVMSSAAAAAAAVRLPPVPAACDPAHGSSYGSSAMPPTMPSDPIRDMSIVRPSPCRPCGGVCCSPPS